MGKSKKIPELTFKEEKKFYKAKIKEQKKEIRKLLNKVEQLEKKLEGKPKVKHKIKTTKETLEVLDKAKLLKDKLKERYSGYTKEE